jgi:DNA-binding NarL/FixJ family response regulator
MKDLETQSTESAIYRSAPLSICVLLVEDDPDQALLTRLGVVDQTQSLFKLEWSDSLKLAVDRLSRPGIDVVLLDLGMPESTGYKTHVTIRLAVGTMPIVVLTSDDSSTSRQTARNMGAANYLIKKKASSVDIRRALWDAVATPGSLGHAESSTGNYKHLQTHYLWY